MRIWRAAKIGLLSLAGILLIPILAVAYLIFFMPPYVLEEKARTMNPAGTIEAVTVIQHVDALSGDGTLVYVLPKGGHFGRSVWFAPHMALHADNVDGLGVSWKNDNELQIHADTAQIFHRDDTVAVFSNGRQFFVKINYDIIHEIH